MRFSELVRGLGSICGGTDGDVSAVVADSRLAGQGALFVAVRGVSKDGHTFVADAIARGASFAVIEDAQCIPAGFCGGVAKVADGRKALGELASDSMFIPPGNCSASVSQERMVNRRPLG
jgi:UDP-N-acetylmuramyl pentapeptide synthase